MQQCRHLMNICKRAVLVKHATRPASSQAAFKETDGQAPGDHDSFEMSVRYRGEVSSDNSKLIRRYLFGDKAARSFRATGLVETTSESRVAEVLYKQIAGQTLAALAQDYEAMHLEDGHVKLSGDALSVEVGDQSLLLLSQKYSRQMWLHTPDRTLRHFDFKKGKWICSENGMNLQTVLSMFLPKYGSGHAQFKRSRSVEDMYCQS